jgi:hypothetical protein
MSVHVGPYEFDHASYDSDSDVLYLRRGEPREAADTFGTPEGHAVRLDEQGEVIDNRVPAPSLFRGRVGEWRWFTADSGVFGRIRPFRAFGFRMSWDVNRWCHIHGT